MKQRTIKSYHLIVKYTNNVMDDHIHLIVKYTTVIY